MASWYGVDFDTCYRDLRDQLPNKIIRLKLQTVPCRLLTRCHGFSVWGDYGDGVIRIGRGLSLSLALDALIHEYAHYLDDNGVTKKRYFHTVAWGANYGRCFGVVFGKD